MCGDVEARDAEKVWKIYFPPGSHPGAAGGQRPDRLESLGPAPGNGLPGG